ncbi:purine-nucleoside phosphorylase [Entomospira culicis]|uniref:Uridine phosphorylase n=1 Tax=Entomospira culicis TaxID=2719989 RepID=A0A968GL09_9SPIO|nr:purine-nucleoside phosphorylase [Entomospira culicis]NIZ19335.1 purine-nucleoside phosphorylase [Entomospira culicis]NIZ69760.1 purine-nucleoside phosphorylase [Entomospira culicis]WDI36871.1 purine-nucleoside phosphorylase [Entomospira culicis]WDI38500.1 purine-nucleoside phosphorylase [Entomospira culicis]
MTAHNEAKVGEIAPNILLPGDPLRAKFIADNYLENVKQYNSVRNMFGFTGTYKGVPVSVQGTGMGIPSISIYVHELLANYGCKNLIRIGSAGAIHEEIKVREIILGTAASTTSGVNKDRFNGLDFAPAADFDLALAAAQSAEELGFALRKGTILSSDIFYDDNPKFYEKWAKYGVLAVEMEAAGLYTLAAKHRARALTLVTVSDHIVTGESTSAEERQNTFTQMMEIALESLVKMHAKG